MTGTSHHRPGAAHTNLRLVVPLIAVMIIGITTCLAWIHRGEPLGVRAGIGSITVTGARPGDSFTAEQHDGTVVEGTANEHGGVVLRGLEPGDVRLNQHRGATDLLRRTVTVPALDDPVSLEVPDLQPGLNYIPARDGTLLSAWVTLPGPVEDGPYPTVVELSAYRIGDVGDEDADSIFETAGTQPATAVAGVFGYATVGVNVRGTGCSGGAFDLFGDAQAADGHDIVEIVARQSWVARGRVGLVGFSLGGLGALHAAATRPPSLDAVVALSVYADAWQMFHPGGLENTGFPVAWLENLFADAAASGTGWISERIAEGDTVCEENQHLRDHRVDPSPLVVGDVERVARFDAISPLTWAPEIDVPVLVSSQFQDATLGADLAPNFERFTASPLSRLVLTNGSHGDGMMPQLIARYGEFLDLTVGRRVPTPITDITEDFLAEADAGVIETLDGVIPTGPPTDSELAAPADFDEALAGYRALAPIEVLWASGAGEPAESASAVAATRFDSWPPGSVRPTTWYLAPDGQLLETRQMTTPDVRIDTASRQARVSWTTEGSDLFHLVYEGLEDPTPSATARWTSPPLETDVALAGTASVDLRIKTSVDDVDLQAVLYEVDDAGNETMIQNGWIRASHRKPTEDTTELRPAVDFDPAAATPLPEGEWTAVRLEIPSFAHVVHRGNRIRLQVGTPGDGQVAWQFGRQPDGDGPVLIGQGGSRPSALVLPVSPVGPGFREPACGTLRSQPCRPEPHHVNTEEG